MVMSSVLLIIALFFFFFLFGLGYVIYTLFHNWTASHSIFEKIVWTIVIILFPPFASFVYSLIREPTWKGKLAPAIISVSIIVLMFLSAGNLFMQGMNTIEESFERFSQEYSRQPEPSNYPATEDI